MCGHPFRNVLILVRCGASDPLPSNWMLDYAANAVAYWPVSHMRERFVANCERIGLDPEEKLKEFLGEDNEPEEFWEKANKNLHDRKLRLLFVADVIPTELQWVPAVRRLSWSFCPVAGPYTTRRNEGRNVSRNALSVRDTHHRPGL